jgi:retron-type reverse transcriptase
VLDVDVRAFFDSVPHDLLLKAVAHQTDKRWVLLDIERWLTAPCRCWTGLSRHEKRGPDKDRYVQLNIIKPWDATPARPALIHPG